MSGKREQRTWRCEYDGETVVDGYCPSCELYNAAVHAQQTAAQHIATQKAPEARDAWLNEYGVFARVGDVTMQLGSAEEAAPFSALTGEARRVKGPFMPQHLDVEQYKNEHAERVRDKIRSIRSRSHP